MGGELSGEVIQGVKTVAGIEALLILAVTTLHFTVVAGRVGADKLVADTKLGGSGLKQSGEIPLAVGETIGKFKAVVRLDALHADSSAGIPLEQLFQKIRRGIGGLLRISGQEAQTGELINGGVLKQAQFRVMRKLGMFPPKEKKPAYKPKPYQQMTYPGQRIQVDVKVVPRRCIADPELRLYQYTAIDEFTRLRFLAAYPEQSTYSSADFLKKLFKWYARRGIRVECVQTDNGFEFTNRFSNSKRDLPTLFETTAVQLEIGRASCRERV